MRRPPTGLSGAGLIFLFDTGSDERGGTFLPPADYTIVVVGVPHFSTSSSETGGGAPRPAVFLRLAVSEKDVLPRLPIVEEMPLIVRPKGVTTVAAWKTPADGQDTSFLPPGTC